MQSVTLTSSQKFTHYSFPLMMATLGLLSLGLLLLGLTNKFITPLMAASAAILFFSLAILSYFNQKKALRFYLLTTSNTDKINSQIIKAILKEHGWQAVKITPNFIQAKGHGFRHKLDLRTWAELMTFELRKNDIRINSICDPSERAQLVSFGKNKQNVEDFERIFLNTPTT